MAHDVRGTARLQRAYALRCLGWHSEALGALEIAERWLARWREVLDARPTSTSRWSGCRRLSGRRAARRASA